MRSETLHLRYTEDIAEEIDLLRTAVQASFLSTLPSLRRTHTWQAMKPRLGYQSPIPHSATALSIRKFWLHSPKEAADMSGKNSVLSDPTPCESVHFLQPHVRDGK